MPELTIEELRAKVAEAERKTASKINALVDARELKELQERLVLSDLEDKYGVLGADLDYVSCPVTGQIVVLRAPTQVEWETFSEEEHNPRTVEELMGKIRVYPESISYQKIIERKNGLVVKLVRVAGKLAGAGAEKLEKK